MKKKIIIIMAILIIIFFIIYKLTKRIEHDKIMYLKDNKEYKNVDVNSIRKIQVNRYTEGGLNSEVIIDKDEAKKLYNRLSNMKYGKETDMSCEDNSTIYEIYFEDGTSKNINIECDWFIIGNKRYLIEK